MMLPPYGLANNVILIFYGLKSPSLEEVNSCELPPLRHRGQNDPLNYFSIALRLAQQLQSISPPIWRVIRTERYGWCPVLV